MWIIWILDLDPGSIIHITSEQMNSRVRVNVLHAHPEDKGDVFSLELIPGTCTANIRFNIGRTIAGSYCISCRECSFRYVNIK